MKIRKIKKSDRKHIESILFNTLFFKDKKESKLHAREVCKKGFGYVLLDGKNPAGFISCVKPKNRLKNLGIQFMALLRRYRRKGLGTLLLRKAESYAKKRKCKFLIARPAVKNKRAIAFYRKNRFKKLGEVIIFGKKLK